MMEKNQVDANVVIDILTAKIAQTEKENAVLQARIISMKEHEEDKISEN